MHTIHITKPGWLCTCGASEICPMPYASGLSHGVLAHPNGVEKVIDHNPISAQ